MHFLYVEYGICICVTKFFLTNAVVPPEPVVELAASPVHGI